jgi:hypothetical protein
MSDAQIEVLEKTYLTAQPETEPIIGQQQPASQQPEQNQEPATNERS